MSYNNNAHISICSIIKNEQDYLKEWLDYHLNIGFDSIYLYEDVNSASHESITNEYSNVYLNKIEDLLDDLFFEKYKDRQLALYNYFLYQKRKEIDWCAFIDIDEYIFVENDSVKEVLKNVPLRVPGLCLYWENYGANGHVKKPVGGLLQNYTKPCKILDKDIRSCFKSFVNLKYADRFTNKHLISGAIDVEYERVLYYDVQPIYHTMWIKHFITKSLEEYKVRLNRGNITVGFRTLDDFFEMNEDLWEYQYDFKPPVIEYKFNCDKAFITLCTIAKNENRYIKEFVDYHLNLGIDRIIIYDNNHINSEDINSIFGKEYCKKVSIVDVKGINIPHDAKVYRNKPYTFHGLQEICYEHCYSHLKDFSDWFIFIDVDEFLTLDNTSLYDYLNESKFDNIDAIQLNWVIYGDNDLLYYENKPVLKRFKNPSPIQKYNNVKTIVRGGKNIEHIDCHIAYSADFKYADSTGNLVPCAYKQNRNVKDAYIRHFFTKTIEEFIERKYSCTSATGKRYFNHLDNRVNEFFKINKDTEEKRKIINNVVKKVDSKIKYIVSFTSYGERLEKLAPIMVESLKNQKDKRFKIVLTVYKEDVKYIPKQFYNDVEIIVSDVDLKPHLKYFYTMQKYKEYPIITVDDDVMYKEDMTLTLYNSWSNNQKNVSCLRAHKIVVDNNGNPINYKDWIWETFAEGPSEYLFATGVGGVIYPPDCLKITKKDIPEIENCLYADDIYLKHKEYKKGIKTICLGKSTLNNIKTDFKKNTLCDENVIEGRNDFYLSKFKII